MIGGGDDDGGHQLREREIGADFNVQADAAERVSAREGERRVGYAAFLNETLGKRGGARRAGLAVEDELNQVGQAVAIRIIGGALLAR